MNNNKLSSSNEDILSASPARKRNKPSVIDTASSSTDSSTAATSAEALKRKCKRLKHKYKQLNNEHSQLQASYKQLQERHEGLVSEKDALVTVIANDTERMQADIQAALQRQRELMLLMHQNQLLQRQGMQLQETTTRSIPSALPISSSIASIGAVLPLKPLSDEIIQRLVNDTNYGNT